VGRRADRQAMRGRSLLLKITVNFSVYAMSVVVGEFSVSVEQWWNGIDRGNLST
jgi:hypothetical protein